MNYWNIFVHFTHFETSPKACRWSKSAKKRTININEGKKIHSKEYVSCFGDILCWRIKQSDWLRDFSFNKWRTSSFFHLRFLQKVWKLLLLLYSRKKEHAWTDKNFWYFSPIWVHIGSFLSPSGRLGSFFKKSFVSFMILCICNFMHKIGKADEPFLRSCVKSRLKESNS